MSAPSGSPVLTILVQYHLVDTEHDAQRIFSVRPMENIVGFPPIHVQNGARPGVGGSRRGG